MNQAFETIRQEIAANPKPGARRQVLIGRRVDKANLTIGQLVKLFRTTTVPAVRNMLAFRLSKDPGVNIPMSELLELPSEIPQLVKPDVRVMIEDDEPMAMHVDSVTNTPDGRTLVAVSGWFAGTFTCNGTIVTGGPRNVCRSASECEAAMKKSRDRKACKGKMGIRVYGPFRNRDQARGFNFLIAGNFPYYDAVVS